MSKIIFVVEYEAKQPMLLRTEGIYDVSTRAVDGQEVPSIISRKMVRPLRDTLRGYAKETGDEWVKKCNFPTEEMCCYCIDCLIFGGVNPSKTSGLNKGVQLRSLIHPSDALAVIEEGNSSVEAETHVGVKEGRVAEIGQALYSPFQIPQGTRFIGTFMIDIDKTSVDKQDFIDMFTTIFNHTRRYGARTAQEGLVNPKILAVIETPYEAVTSYDLYGVVIKETNWGKAVEDYLKKLKKEVPDLKSLKWNVQTKDNLIKKSGLLNKLVEKFRQDLKSEGVEPKS